MFLYETYHCNLDAGTSTEAAKFSYVSHPLQCFHPAGIGVGDTSTSLRLPPVGRQYRLDAVHVRQSDHRYRCLFPLKAHEIHRHHLG